MPIWAKGKRTSPSLRLKTTHLEPRLRRQEWGVEHPKWTELLHSLFSYYFLSIKINHLFKQITTKECQYLYLITVIPWRKWVVCSVGLHWELISQAMGKSLINPTISLWNSTCKYFLKSSFLSTQWAAIHRLGAVETYT